jgi:hypothetical protein
VRPPLFAIDLGYDLIRTAFARPDGSVHEGPTALPDQSLEALLEKAQEQIGLDFREIVLALPLDSPRPQTEFTVVRHLFRPLAALEACPGLGPCVVVIEAHPQGWTQTRWQEDDGIWEHDLSLQPPNHILVVGGPPCRLTAQHINEFTAPIHFPHRPEWTVVHGAALFARRLCGTRLSCPMRGDFPRPGNLG